MALITWDQSYSVKVAELDGHHQKLFFLLNTLHDAMREGKGSSVIQTIVVELANYTHTHFQREEALMEQTKFPGLDVHRVEHQKLMAKVSEYKAALDKGSGVNTSAVLEFLREWLAKHINRMDKAYASHLNASGIH
ncbi:MAG TPA: bacteriohemerythrin [Terriglobales bacterium]|nr:bacteriohemerythrin [Terriglobales bacterium]